MQTSASKAAGFTLIELLLVLLLLGLLVGAGLRLTWVEENDEGEALQQLSLELALLQQESILSGNLLGLDFYEATAGASTTQWQYRWLQWQEGKWRSLQAAVDGLDQSATPLTLINPVLIVAQQPYTPEPLVSLEPVDQQEKDFVPEVLVMPSHEVTAFSLQLTNKLMRADGFGRTEVVDALR